MSYRIAQDFQYVGNDYWRWWAWIEAEDADLDKLEEVVWILHPSFKQSRVVKRQRPDKFRLETAGWGTFLLRAELSLPDGEKLTLKHNLRLEYPESSEAAASEKVRRAPTIYLSYSTQDVREAEKVRARFMTAGLQVFDQTQLRPGDPWNEALGRMMAQSDAAVGLVCEDEISPWVSSEIKAALAASKPTLVLLGPSASNVKLPSDVKTLTFDVNQFERSQNCCPRVESSDRAMPLPPLSLPKTYPWEVTATAESEYDWG
jgi:TIR domain/YEATS family